MPDPKVATPVDVPGDIVAGDDAEPGRKASPPAWVGYLAVARRIAGSRVIKYGFVVVAVGLAAFAVASDWAQIRAALASLGVLPVAAALVCVVLAQLTAVQVWRLLLGSLGSPLPVLPAARILLVCNLGKYLPGSIWQVVASMELGKAYRVPRSQTGSAAVLAMLVTLITGLLTALITLPFVPGALPYRWALLAAPVLLVMLYPRFLNALIGRVLQLARQAPLAAPLTARSLVPALSWAFGTWICYGLQIWILASRLGAPAGKTALLAIGGFAFAWSVGFLVIFAPAGAGVRDVLLLLVLSSVLSTADATAVMLTSRVLLTVADLLGAGVATKFIHPPRGPAADPDISTDLA